MANTWRLTLAVKSSSDSNTKALANALATDEIVNWSDEGSSFSFELNETKAKDLRAMWNTRIRGLIAVDSLLEVLGKPTQSEDSSKSNQ